MYPDVTIMTQLQPRLFNFRCSGLGMIVSCSRYCSLFSIWVRPALCHLDQAAVMRVAMAAHHQSMISTPEDAVGLFSVTSLAHLTSGKVQRASSN